MTVMMKDIARDLGVSVVTISKALRDHRSNEIGRRTAKLILEIFSASERSACKKISLQPRLARASTARKAAGKKT
jgi:DNA-binding LacI/PurR family transcriptional regulator